MAIRGGGFAQRPRGAASAVGAGSEHDKMQRDRATPPNYTVADWFRTVGKYVK